MRGSNISEEIGHLIRFSIAMSNFHEMTFQAKVLLYLIEYRPPAVINVFQDLN